MYSSVKTGQTAEPAEEQARRRLARAAVFEPPLGGLWVRVRVAGALRGVAAAEAAERHGEDSEMISTSDDEDWYHLSTGRPPAGHSMYEIHNGNGAVSKTDSKKQKQSNEMNQQGEFHVFIGLNSPQKNIPAKTKTKKSYDLGESGGHEVVGMWG